MGIKQYKPRSPGLRWTAISDFKELTASKPEKSLTESIKKTGGRNFQGRVTSRWIGGGHKRRYRIIDFKRNKFDKPGKVLSVIKEILRDAAHKPICDYRMQVHSHQAYLFKEDDRVFDGLSLCSRQFEWLLSHQIQ